MANFSSFLDRYFAVLLIVGILFTFLFSCYVIVPFLLSFDNRGVSQWKTAEVPSVGSDHHGNISVIDEQRNAVSMVATGVTGNGWAAKISDTHLTVKLHNKPYTVREIFDERFDAGVYRVRRVPDHLTILLPNGLGARFRISDSFVSNFKEFTLSQGSRLRYALELFEEDDQHQQLKSLLASFDEPDIYLKKHDTSKIGP